jgi:type II secretion system (T2SS) protein E
MSKPSCHRKGCNRICSDSSLFLSRRRAPRFEGHPICSESCLYSHVEYELSEKWQQRQRDKHRKIPRLRLGTILLQAASITPNQLDEAVRLQQEMREGRLGEWLRRLGFVEEHQVTRALSKQYGIPLINLKGAEAKNDALSIVPAVVARGSNVLPVGYDTEKDFLRIAVAAPVNFNSHEAMRRMLRMGVSAYIGDESEILTLLDQWYGFKEQELSNVPSFSSLDGLQDLAKTIVGIAIDGRAHNIQAELLESYLWVRTDAGLRTDHYFCRHVAHPSQVPAPLDCRRGLTLVPNGMG